MLQREKQHLPERNWVELDRKDYLLGSHRFSFGNTLWGRGQTNLPSIFGAHSCYLLCIRAELYMPYFDHTRRSAKPF